MCVCVCVCVCVLDQLYVDIGKHALSFSVFVFSLITLLFVIEYWDYTFAENTFWFYLLLDWLWRHK